MKKFIKFLKYSFLFCFILGLLLAAGGAYWLYYQIVKVPAPEMTEANISAILGRESPVYYSDGVTQFGVLFEDVHRQYVKYDEIPKHFIQALIAAEDDQYFNHFGVDPMGIARALLANYRAGRVVQGGSTLTQQTAKNLFKRESRSLRAKIKELMQAFRLEYYFSKEKILEFYCNQFYVSGNGHGLGVAARYFFDKEPAELTLVEAAFIAGCVKQPNYYNPFLKKNREDPIEARKRAMIRVRYVLGQMREKGMLSAEEFAVARTTELEFRQGKMSYGQNATMDLLKEGLGSPILMEFLEENGISNISTSGARIITTLDKDLQDQTVYALRRHLSRLDVQLRGYRREAVQKEYAELEYQGDEEIVPRAFVFGTLGEVDADSGLFTVELADGAQGLLARDGLAKTAKGQLKPGDRVYVSVQDRRAENGEFLLDLERYPKVDGGAIVLQKGAIRAMSSGMSNVHFNRATSAARNMGSTFKTLVYAAAIQLGWSPADLLNNRPNTFTFNGAVYTPAASHRGAAPDVTMSWAGVKSENLASVWLLYHLTDKVDKPGLREMALQLGMAPWENGSRQETVAQYRARLHNRFHFNLKVSDSMMEQAVYDTAVRALKADFLFAGHQEEYDRLSRLPYDAASAFGGEDGSFLRIRQCLKDMIAYRQYLEHYQPIDPDQAFDMPDYVLSIGESSRQEERDAARENAFSRGGLYRSSDGALIFSLHGNMAEGWQFMPPGEAQRLLAGKSHAEELAFWQGVRLEGWINAESVAEVEEQIKVERQRFDKRNLYSLNVLCEIREFRVMVGLQYLMALARACGVDSHFEPVLPTALGANVVTLSEIARIYEAMVTGNRYDPADAASMERLEGENRSDRDGLSLIERIVTPDGREVYRRSPHATRVFDGRTSAAIGSILQNVVRYGTGRRAQAVQLHAQDADQSARLARLKHHLPLLGKTGTANENRNVAFLGYVPVLAQDDSSVLALENGYTVGVYVGHDRNQKMSRGIDGAHGALPAWTVIAQALVDHEQIGDRADPVDLQFNSGLPLRYPDVGQVFLPVSEQSGVPSGPPGKHQLIAPDYAAILDVGGQEKGRFAPQRNFLPFWRLPEESKAEK